MLVNRTGLAEVFGIAVQTVDAYVREGMPYRQRADRSVKQEWQFDTKACIEWYVQKKTPKQETEGEGWASARARDRAAQATIRELHLRQKIGELVPIDIVLEHVGTEYGIVKSGLRVIPGRMAQVLSDMTDVEEIEALLKKEVDEALEALSDINADTFRDD